MGSEGYEEVILQPVFVNIVDWEVEGAGRVQ